MRVIIDAWNVLHVTGILPPGLAGLDLTGLARLLCRSRWIAAHPVLVCDGTAQATPGMPQAVRVLWSGPTAEADDLIEQHIARTSAPNRLTVVSSDRRLQRAARRRNCKSLSSEDFLRSILSDLGGSGPSSTHFKPHPGGSTHAWHAQFDFAPEDLEALQDEVAQADLPGIPDPAPPEAKAPESKALGASEPSEPQRSPPVDLPPDLIEQAIRIARGEA